MFPAFENVWESRVEWVEIVKRCLVVRLADGDNIEVEMERKKGKYLKSLKGWLLDHRNLRLHLHPGTRWMEAEAEFLVFRPKSGLNLPGTFLRVEEGEAFCRVEVEFSYSNFLKVFLVFCFKSF